uniref:Uncharacterized protein n=1 Tax=Leviviridae sp. TaxID=2027243 RepID=A0A514DCW6_9VIRU|nr:MAG: hypothetical protein H4Bulk46879_000002 [Leviviridae sp.]
MVFGWKPFIRDLRDLYKAMKGVNASIAKLASQNGQNVRRRAVLKNENTSAVTDQGSYLYPFANVYGAPPNWFNNQGRTQYTVTTRTQTQIWYSACYRYWIPNLPAWKESWGTRAKLFGVYPTPGSVYAAMPWSWLEGWFSDIGEIANAASPTAVDGLTMKYGYTMQHDTYEVEATSQVYHPPSKPIKNSLGEFGGDWQGCDITFSSTFKRERKLRTGGVQPFGPGVKLADITPSRWAILAALGLSRSDLKL